MESQPNSQATTYTTAMSPSTSLPTKVSTEDYNALVARLDAEVRARAQLETQLRVTRDRAAYLERCLNGMTASRAGSPSSAPMHTFINPTPAVSDDGSAPSDVQRSLQPRQDKEVLSHCSDISNCKAVRPTDSTASRVVSSGAATQPSPAPLASATNAKPVRKHAVAGGAVRKSKTKKERPNKVKIPGQSRYWTPEEHKLFLEALQKFGHKDLRAISAHVGTRNMTQVRTHSQKYFMRLMREAKRQNPSASKPAEPNAKAEESNTQSETKSPTQNNSTTARDIDEGDKYSVPSTCGMTLLCLVGQDTLPV